jgi:mRNA degradation ribonuclease J1/J2
LLAKGEEREELAIPAEAFFPLAGMRRNTLDVNRSYIGKNELKARGLIPQVGKRFEMHSSVERSTRYQSMNLDQKPVSGIEGIEKRLAALKWTIKESESDPVVSARKMAHIKQFGLFGHNILRRGFREAMGAMGVLNLTHGDMLNERDYPCLQDHLTRYNLLDTAQSSSNPPEKEEGRFVLTSIGGNNLREIYPGIGEDIGGNCKTVETQWIDEGTGEVLKVGAVLDFGSYLIRKNSEWTAGHPDIVEKLGYCRDIFITHHHIDHIDALIPYIKRRLVNKGHTVHMTPEVAEMLNDKLNKAGVNKDDPRRPEINMLEDTGAIDFHDENGVKRMTVVYGANAVPHSARATPYIAYGRKGKNILGSYMYLGDMRYDEDWFEARGEQFWNPEELKKLIGTDIKAADLVPTYTELDATSAKREGRGASEQTVENNLVHILNNWFPDRHSGISIIGTADGRRETLLRAANHTSRKMTGFGAAVEFLFRIANKFGVNPYRVKRPEKGKYTGIDDYLAWHAKENDLEGPVDFKQRTSKAVRSWFEEDNPGGIMAVLSGSQGNPIEFESMTYKLSDSRSFWDADPGKLHTARPADLKQWAVIFSQGAIPGNGKYQRALIKRLASRGAVVLEAFEENVRIHNPGKLKNRILQDLVRTGKIAPGNEKSVIEADGSIVVENMPIHASGHGRRGDMRLWLRKIQSKFYGLHHTDDRESVMAGYDTMEEEGKQHPGNIFENGVEVEITRNSVKPIGRIMNSVILTRERAEEGKHYNKILDAIRVPNFDDRSPHHELGLRGSVGGVTELHFGTRDMEEIRKKEFKVNKRDISKRSGKIVPIPKRLYRGIEPVEAPDWQPLDMAV